MAVEQWMRDAAIEISGHVLTNKDRITEEWAAIIASHAPREAAAQPTVMPSQPLASYLSRTYNFSTQDDTAEAMEIGRELFEAGRRQSDKLQLLASAMKKVLPPDLLQEVIDHCDPLRAFLREMAASPEPRTPEK